MNSFYLPNTSTNELRSNQDNKIYLGRKHMLCSYSYKTSSLRSKKKKVYHHDKLDIECRSEKICLLALLEEFNNAVLALRPFIDAKNMRSSIEYETVLKQYESSRKRIINQEQLDVIFVNKDTLTE